MINITTVQNGFVLRGEQHSFTNSELPDTYQVLNDTQIWIEGDMQIILLDTSDCTIDGKSCTSATELIQALGL